MNKNVVLLLFLIVNLFSFSSNEELLAISKNDISKEKEKKELTKDKYIRIKGNFVCPGEVQGTKYNSSENGKIANLKTSIEGMLEGVYRINKTTEIALGLGIQQIGYLDTNYGVQKNNYAFPFYFSGKYNILKSSVYIKGLLGFTFNIGSKDLQYFITEQENPSWGLVEEDIKINSGLYSGIGLGMDLGKFEIEMLYSTNKVYGEFNYNNIDYKRELDNNKLTLGISYAFNTSK